jgi:hypothetical protein
MKSLTINKHPQWVQTPQLTKSLGSSDLCRHHAHIAIELEVLSKKFDRFGWERDRNTKAHDRMIQDWIHSLQDFTLEEIQRACQQAVEINPNKRPNEAHIKKIILANRSKYRQRAQPVAPHEAPPRVVVTQEQAQSILEDVGYRPKIFGKKND